MLEAFGYIAFAVFVPLLFFVGVALGRKFKAQAAFFNAEARRSQSDAAYVRFLRERHPPRYKGRIGGLPETMLPREFQSSYPKV